ncbi:cysteine proteinase [Cystobasidium minutum MCA 4210]|uniref:cysteine proteinase n=1 Tax=Cystobasidium minutum MCA 4210 TaxID=1397322 RepID=UPI0034CF5B74|eukprot:jgi/Rhomi1/56130/CE56129_223
MQGIGQLALHRANKVFAAGNGQIAANGDLHAAAALNGSGKDVQDNLDAEDSNVTYPGLVNTSTTCYLNSTLQSLASCPSFVAYLTSLVESSDIHLELTNALLLMLQALNKPSKYGLTLRTNEILHSLMNSTSSSNASRNRRRIMQGSGQQDAQEFFLILTETVEEEKKVLFEKLAKKREEKLGFRELLMPLELLDSLTRVGRDDTLKNPFQSLMAHRTSCLTCGYAEAIRHLPTENLTLNVPSARACHLETLLAEYTKLETIEEFGCRKCSLMITRNRLQEQLTAQKTSEAKLTASKKKRIRELQRNLASLDEIIQIGDFETDLSSLAIKLDRAIGPATKQVMFSAPPKLLVLHLSRSSFYEGTFGYSQKNNCVVQFPEYLDMDAFTTSYELNMSPTKPISRVRTNSLQDGSHPPADTSESIAAPNTLFSYALAAVVVHIGNHSSGHYLTYRRRPRRPSAGLSTDWYRISDEDVERATASEVFRSNPFLLFYERLHRSRSHFFEGAAVSSSK